MGRHFGIQLSISNPKSETSFYPISKNARNEKKLPGN
jgi:hypothetical protein